VRVPARRPRALAPTGFSPHLDALLDAVPEALAAVFIDDEGETVDLSTRVDDYEARVAGASLAQPLARARAASRASGHGQVVELRVLCDRQAVLARHVGDTTDLVTLLGAPSVAARSAARVAAAATALRSEAGLPPEASAAVLRTVEHRASGSGAPRSFDHEGQRLRVVDVLGALRDDAQACWLVRVHTGEELLLQREAATGRWLRAL
jgi:predicted regulator of Ras-like GTPase activity (Roadblock/LC7/MglB family)